MTLLALAAALPMASAQAPPEHYKEVRIRTICYLGGFGLGQAQPGRGPVWIAPIRSKRTYNVQSGGHARGARFRSWARASLYGLGHTNTQPSGPDPNFNETETQNTHRSSPTSSRCPTVWTSTSSRSPTPSSWTSITVRAHGCWGSCGLDACSMSCLDDWCMTLKSHCPIDFRFNPPKTATRKLVNCCRNDCYLWCNDGWACCINNAGGLFCC